MNILALETSTPVCSVALLLGDQMASLTQMASNRHADLILTMIERLLVESTLNLADLDCIAYDKGPGSFTGLRIAASVAQGLAYGAKLNTLGISSLWVTAYQAQKETNLSSFYVTQTARQDEVYYGVYRYQAPYWHLLLTEGVTRIQDLPDSPCATHLIGSACASQGKTLTQRFNTQPTITTPFNADAETIARIAQYQYAHENVQAEALALPSYLREKVVF